MAHDISGAVWILDTSSASIITKLPVKVNLIIVTWMISSAGTLELTQQFAETSASTKSVLLVKCAGASTAATNDLSQPIYIGDHIYQNLWLKTATNIDSIYIYTR